MAKFMPSLQSFRQFASEALRTVEQDIKTRSSATLDSQLFDDARKRIYGEGRSINKVVVTVKEPNGIAKTHLVNQNVSTPLTCAKHVSRALASSSALCRVTYDVGGHTEYASMHEPFTRKCEVEFLSIDSNSTIESKMVNNAYWRSAAVLLGATLSKGVSNAKYIELEDSDVAKSFFSVKLLQCPEWNPSAGELNALSRFASNEFVKNRQPFEYLQISDDLASEYGFTESFGLCRLGDFVTKVSGPLITNCEQIGKFAILKVVRKGADLHFAGTSVPSSQLVSSYSWNVIQEHAADLFK